MAQDNKSNNKQSTQIPGNVNPGMEDHKTEIRIDIRESNNNISNTLEPPQRTTKPIDKVPEKK